MRNKIFIILLFSVITGIVFTLSYSKEANTSNTSSDTLYAINLLSKMNFKSLTRAADNDSSEALAKIKTFAEHGDVKAQYWLGEFYIKKNPRESVKWYGKALDQKNTKALYRLHRILNNYDYLDVHDNVLECLEKNDDNFSVKRILGFFHVNGDYPDEVTGEKYFNSIIEAANQGNSEAQRQLGIAYKESSGIGLESSYEKALFWLKKAADHNNAGALFDLGNIYDRGDCGLTENHIEAFNLYIKAAQLGNSEAMSRLASIYEKSEIISQDKHEAAQWRLKSVEYGEDNVYTLYSKAKDGDTDSRSALYELAEKGYDDAQYHLGLIYHYVDRNYNEAGKWYLRAYKLGNTGGLTDVISLTERGIPEAIEITRDLAEIGGKHAQAMLGLVYSRGSGVKQDFNESIKWLRKSAAQNYDFAQYLLGLMYYHGNGVKQDYVEAAKLISKASSTGLMGALQAMRDPNLLYGAGIMYRDGLDVKQDKKNASRLFHEAAAGGSIEANFILGDMYENGKDTQKNHTKAIDYYVVAARAGHQRALSRLRYLAEYGNTNAMYNLGLIYGYNEEGYKEGLKWLDMAAKKGHVEAIKTMGILADSDIEALKLLRTYAEQGSTQAQLDLANIYYGGGSEFLNIEPDFREAAIWFNKSAEKNNMIAQYRLGIMYLNGEGLEKNKDEAIKWLLKAANQGYKPAKNQLAGLGIYPEQKSTPIFKENGYISGNKVNLRSSPSTNSRVIAQFNNGHPINIGQKRGDWYFIKTANGKEGWIFKKYIKLK